MTKEELNRYFWLRHEIIKQQRRLERLRNKPAGEVVGDTVNDYRTGRGIPVKITGTPADEFSRPIMIHMLEAEIQKNIEESETAAVQIEQFVQGIEEPRLRELLRCRFIDCMKWEELGQANYMDPDHARRLIREFLKSLPR